MSNTSTFGFTNVTAFTDTLNPTLIGPSANYAKIGDEPTYCILSNKTAPLDQGELITYRANEIKKISTSQTLQNPLPIKNGIQYVIKAEEILRTKDADGNIIGDEPVVAYLTIRHQKSGNITSGIVEAVVQRLLGACYLDGGTAAIPRWNDLMRSSLVPTSDSQ